MNQQFICIFCIFSLKLINFKIYHTNSYIHIFQYMHGFLLKNNYYFGYLLQILGRHRHWLCSPANSETDWDYDFNTVGAFISSICSSNVWMEGWVNKLLYSLNIIYELILIKIIYVKPHICLLLFYLDPDWDLRLENYQCLVSQDISYQIFATASSFYVPLLVILFLYWRIFLTARKRIRRRQQVICSQ